jgi:probable rRNA maturation factor
MSSDEPPQGLRVSVTDRLGHCLRKPGLARWLRRVAPSRARGEVSVALVPDSAMRRLNRQFAGVDKATDVLSFPEREGRAGRERSGPAAPGRHLGDIVIATGRAARQAKGAGHSYDTELRVLALHGLLHLLGYDHASDKGTMARLERRLRRKGGLREGLIDRAGVRPETRVTTSRRAVGRQR